MTYASLSEVYGNDFSSLMNPKDKQQQDQYITRKTNPNTINNNRSTNLVDIKNNSVIQEQMDYNTHTNSFKDISPSKSNNNYERAWENNEMTMMLSPKENLKQSLLKDRNIQSMGTPSADPSAYSQMNPYKSFHRTECDDMFYHLDSCRKCQAKLKKRVVRYFNMLQQNNKSLLLPGTSGMDSQLFIDPPQPETENIQPEPAQVKKQEVKENFLNKKDKNSGIFLMLFGLFVLYALDSQSK